jgi:hypothetical protein
MCSFVIVIIMIALILFMPAIYAMGITRGIVRERTQECAEGAPADVMPPSTAASTSTGLPSTQPQTKCSKCAKVKYCMNPAPGMSLFC